MRCCGCGEGGEENPCWPPSRKLIYFKIPCLTSTSMPTTATLPNPKPDSTGVLALSNAAKLLRFVDDAQLRI